MTDRCRELVQTAKDAARVLGVCADDTEDTPIQAIFIAIYDRLIVAIARVETEQ